MLKIVLEIKTSCLNPKAPSHHTGVPEKGIKNAICQFLSSSGAFSGFTDAIVNVREPSEISLRLPKALLKRLEGPRKEPRGRQKRFRERKSTVIDVVHALCGLKNEHERTQKNGKCVFCQENRKALCKNERECGRMSDSGQRGMKRTKMQESLTTAGRNDKITTVRRTGALP